MIIPENFPYTEDPSRDAEKIVFEKLKEIFGNEKDFDIYYNVEIDHGSSSNVHREDWEIDFIIFNEKIGVLIIEVKGGNPIENGIPLLETEIDMKLNTQQNRQKIINMH